MSIESVMPSNYLILCRLLEWVAFPSPGDLPDPCVEPASPALAGGFFTAELPEVSHSPGLPNTPILVTGSFLHCFLIHTSFF